MYSIDTQMPLIKYYWRVSVVQGVNVSSWSDPRSFTYIGTGITPTPATATPTATSQTLTAPVLVFPADNATLIPVTQILSWEAIAGTATYALQIDDASNFETPLVNLPSISGTTHSLMDGLPVGTYYWRVAAVNNVMTSPWSVIRTFTFASPEPSITPSPTATQMPDPVLVSPADNSLLTNLGPSTINVAFKWTYPMNGMTYTVQLDDDDAFGSINQTCTTIALTCIISGVTSGEYAWRLLVNNEVFETFATFTISPMAPRAVTLVSPFNNRVLPPTERPTVILAWSWGTTAAPAGAPFTYEVEVSASSTFTTLTAAVLEVPTFTTPTLMDGTYYWRSRAVNQFNIPGAWSTTSSFIVDSIAPQIAPVITAPSANAVLSSARPTITWSAVAGASRYSVEINDVCDGQTVAHLSTTSIVTTTYTLPATASALPQGDYVACVTAYDLSGNTITSEPRHFTVSLALTPARGAFIVGAVKPTFTWTAAAGLASETIRYRVILTQFIPGQDLSVVTSPLLTNTSYTWPSTLTAGNYSWRLVRSVNGVDDTPQSPWFFVGALPIGPTLTAPTVNMLINTPIQLAWNAGITPAGVDAIDYQVQVSRTSTFTSLLVDGVVQWNSPTAFSYTPDIGQNRVTHYWRVRGLWYGLPVTNWSTRTFIVDTVAPTAPLISVPTAIVNTVRPVISWGTVPGATQYRLSIVVAESLDPIVTPLILNTVSYTPTVNLPQDTLIVQIEASDGLNWSQISSRTFTVRLGTAPAQNATVTTNRPVFSWGAVPGATSYTLEVDNNADFSSPVISVAVSALTYTPTAQQALIPGVYIWRVKPSNGDYPTVVSGRTFIYGAVIKPLLPVVASLLTPSVPDTVFNAIEAETLIFGWAGLSPAPLRYQIDISTSSTFELAGTLTRTSPTSSLTLLGSDLTVDGIKYWRVRGIYSDDATGFGPWSDVKLFTLDRVAPTVPLLNLTAPLVSSSARPTLSWFASATATRYILNMVVDSANTPVDALIDRVVTATSYALPTTLPALLQNNGGYQWWVQAEDAAGNRSPRSLSRKIVIFSGVKPALGEIVTDTTPTFTWSGITGVGAANWTLQIASNAVMTENLYISPVLLASATSFTLPNTAALPYGRYFWRVIRSTEDPTRINGQPFFVVASMARAMPVIVMPANGQTLNAVDLYAGDGPLWTAPLEPGIAANMVKYRLEIATANTFTPASMVIAVDTNISNGMFSGWSAYALSEGTYYWRVRAVLAPSLTPGPWTAVLQFKTDKTAPSAPILTAPVSNAVLTDSTPMFTWATATDTPTQYVLEVDNNVNFGSLTYTITIAAPTLTHTIPAAKALPNGLYHWRVRAKDASGNLSVVSGGQALTIAAP